jgi:outer membrane protein assembly factor BamB
MILRNCFTPAVLIVLSVAAVSAENWPQWRGPGGQGISTESAVPTTWAPGRHIQWKTPLPPGHSSPIVWGDRIFVTAAIEGEAVPGHKAVAHTLEGEKNWIHPDSVGADRKQRLELLSIDAKDGRILWERVAYDGPVYDARHRRSSFAGPTAVTDGRQVFAYFGPEGLYAYDFAGTLQWKVVELFATLGLAAGTSPVLFGNLVIIQRDEDNGDASVIVAYDKTTGKQAWRTKRTIEVSWATPVLVTAGGRTELVTNGNQFIISYDPRTGRELWRTKGVEAYAIHTPLVGKGLVILSGGYPQKRVIAVRPGNVDASRRVAWVYTKGTGYVVSNILYGDDVYLLNDQGVVTCLDAATGAVKYEGGRPPVPARFTSSPVAFGGLIGMTSEEGETFMLKAGTVHSIVGRNSVDEPVYSSPAISNGRVYIRGARHLFAIGG